MELTDLKTFLDEKTEEFNRPEFVETDPIQVARAFSEKENIEIAGFLTATIAWGNRTAIIKNAFRMMEMLENQPHDFILNASKTELRSLSHFVHRTFNGSDLIYFVHSLRNIYRNHDGLQVVFETGFKNRGSVFGMLNHFHGVFFEKDGARTQKHVPNVQKGASAKRLNIGCAVQIKPVWILAFGKASRNRN
jgi:uncharacterized protein (TIGR02757 family)